ncbi:MAG: RagB/SusD family nutrient uptake outer membrane protein [Chitinophagaceae bacterium]|nr:RagB/SusD family nutrient uptake outer membrane protein [Chitinophagaceae bacterium]
MKRYLPIPMMLAALPALVLFSCNKYLDERPEKTTVVISSLDDVQKLLDKNDVINQGSVHSLLEMVSDDYYVTSSELSSLNKQQRENYLWDPSAYMDNAWTTTYQRPVYYANIILDQLPGLTIKAIDRTRYDELYGAALFFRSWGFYHLAQLFCKPYSGKNAQEPGIVLRLSAAILDKSVRSTIQRSYDQIIGDLKLAAEKLPEAVNFPTRPNKAAAFGALARVYLSMGAYAEAGKFADSCLIRNNELMDYNLLDSNSTIPFVRFNKETIFYSTLALENIVTMNYAKTDTNLLASYQSGDLRRGMFFASNPNGTVYFNGSYEGSSWVQLFNGIATDEIYLIKAEAAARAGNTGLAMQTLNHLLTFRWKAGEFTELQASTPGEALGLILTERRKELLFRGLRWTDLRRLNEEGYGISIKRLFNGQEYTLPANDPRWVMLIPPSIMSSTDLSQNPR